jgi:MYXO-CTERM domain-containing protein
VLGLALGLLLGLWPAATFPCGGPPPPPPIHCASQLTCVLGSPQILFSTQSGSNGNPDITSVEVPARLHHSFNPNGNVVCFPVQLLEIEVEADCEEMVVDGSSAQIQFSGQAPANYLGPGSQIVDVPLEIDIPAADREERGYCALSGTARLIQSDGQEIETRCGESFLSFVRPTLSGDAPIVGGHFVHPLDKTQVGKGHYTTLPFAPKLIEVQVTNNHESESFSANLEVVTNNENYKADVVTDELTTHSDASLTYSLSSGDGDDFVLQFAAGLQPGGCFDLPEPQYSISPTATSELVLAPGETQVLSLYGRTWSNCADGSCSGMTFELNGAFSGGETYQAYLGGSLLVKTFDLGLANPLICPAQGKTAEILKCEEQGILCHIEEARGQDPERRAGLVIDSELLDAQPAVLSAARTISVTTTSEEIAEEASGSEGRLWETLWIPRGSMTPGQLVTATANFDIVLVGEVGDLEITEIVVGSKYQPPSEETGGAPTSFIGVGRIEISTSPYTEISTQYQAGAWTVDADSTELKRLEITQYDLTATASGLAASFTFVAPDYNVDKVHISHDLRGYAWTAFEDVCDDLSDNDNDSLVDCDDSDCDGHPACDDGDDDDSATGDDDDDSATGDDDDDDDDDNGAGDDDDSAAGQDDGGCSCSVAQGGLPAGLALLLLPALGLARRRRVGE